MTNQNADPQYTILRIRALLDMLDDVPTSGMTPERVVERLRVILAESTAAEVEKRREVERD